MTHSPHDDTTRTRTRIRQTRRNTSDWKQHKSWIREAVITGESIVQAGQRQGIHRATVWSLCELPSVKRYVSSLRRWQSDRALQARIERDMHSGEVVSGDQSIE